MPLVTVARDPKCVDDNTLRWLADILPVAVAQCLTVDSVLEAKLSPNEVEVRFTDFGPFDRRTCPLEIVVFANDFPERRASLKERVRRINDILFRKPDKNDFWVWVLLATGEFWETKY